MWARACECGRGRLSVGEGVSLSEGVSGQGCECGRVCE